MNRVIPVLILLYFFTACSQPEKRKLNPKRFHAMLESYWQGLLDLQPLDAMHFGDSSRNDQFRNTCTQAYRDEVKEFYLGYSDSLKHYDPKDMAEEDAISYQILKYDVDLALEGAKFDTWKIPFTQMGDPTNKLSGNIVLAMGQYGSGESAQPFHSVKDYYNWLKRVKGYTIWCDSAIENFRKGIATNYVLPKALVVKMVAICNGLVSNDVTKSIFYGPIRNLPVNFSPSEKDSITQAYQEAIWDDLNVANKKMADFLKNEYLPKARVTSGVEYLPNGINYYKYCVKRWTTTNKPLEDIFNTGLNEVKRIRAEMEEVKQSTGFTGDLNAFFHFMRTDKQFFPFTTASQVLDSFRHIYDIIKPNLDKYFVLFPKSKFEIRQTEAFRAASASIEYMQGSSDGKRPGIFYVPIIDPKEFNVTSGMESTFLHEAVPGHHYQSSLQMEDSLLPSFRRYKSCGAYDEGWALYCESLGKELGLYTNPYQHMGALSDEMLRALRLVVDVAIHSKGMTREEAIKFMIDNEPISEDFATSEVERYMAIPGQALSYKVGALKIIELREKYSKQLGKKFNIAEFHKQVLNSGSMPLMVLEEKLDKWADALSAK
ncbi:MAG: DUF885 domain-containing protein [Chitinophagaceae bacterium]|nr:DUF885 domain-containing protein [Bacteroidota bacterium]MBS1927487.1 DUF885 domain-containing protein [Bacteroidota bacterium]MCC6256688.1 DUF885 domain-containing protein [Chitinophagaceae bacterium]MCW5916047.1 DUF885 domain-containing protein [Ferruginibacter sp.]